MYLIALKKIDGIIKLITSHIEAFHTQRSFYQKYQSASLKSVKIYLQVKHNSVIVI